jgi:hypothetical protein
MIATETPAQEDLPAVPKSNYRASGLVHRPVAAGRKFICISKEDAVEVFIFFDGMFNSFDFSVISSSE